MYTKNKVHKLSVLWRQALLTAAENTSHDGRKIFEILAAKLLNTLLKFALSFSFHLLSLLWVFVWLLSSSGGQLALRGSAVREPIWEPLLALADSTCCWIPSWQSCGLYLGSWQQFLAETVRKMFERCLPLDLTSLCWGDDCRVGVCPTSLAW